MVTVLVLMGGVGREREVSLQSGRQVVKALKAAGYRVLESDISPDDLTALDIEEFRARAVYVLPAAIVESPQFAPALGQAR